MYRDYKNDSFLIRNILYFSDMPLELLGHFEEMGKDDLPVLNEYEAEYIAFIFSEFDIKNKKIAFIGGKASFFPKNDIGTIIKKIRGWDVPFSIFLMNLRKRKAGDMMLQFTHGAKYKLRLKELLNHYRKKILGY